MASEPTLRFPVRNSDMAPKGHRHTGLWVVKHKVHCQAMLYCPFWSNSSTWEFCVLTKRPPFQDGGPERKDTEVVLEPNKEKLVVWDSNSQPRWAFLKLHFHGRVHYFITRYVYVLRFGEGWGLEFCSFSVSPFEPSFRIFCLGRVLRE